MRSRSEQRIVLTIARIHKPEMVFVWHCGGSALPQRLELANSSIHLVGCIIANHTSFVLSVDHRYLPLPVVWPKLRRDGTLAGNLHASDGFLVGPSMFDYPENATASSPLAQPRPLEELRGKGSEQGTGKLLSTLRFRAVRGHASASCQSPNLSLHGVIVWCPTVHSNHATLSLRIVDTKSSEAGQAN